MIWNSAVCCVFTCNKQVTGRPPDSISLQIFFQLNSVNYFSYIIVSFLFMLLYLRLLSYLFRFSHTIIIVMHQYTKAYSFVCVILFKPISDVFIPVETNICTVYCFFFFLLQASVCNTVVPLSAEVFGYLPSWRSDTGQERGACWGKWSTATLSLHE